MTREEALSILKIFRITGDKHHEAFDMAIKALEQTEPEKCNDCISRQAAFDEIIWNSDNGVIDAKVAIETLRKLPSVEPERKTGKWEYVVSTADVYGKWVCSECNKLIIGSSTQKPQHNYCPNCGADMREVEKE